MECFLKKHLKIKSASNIAGNYPTTLKTSEMYYFLLNIALFFLKTKSVKKLLPLFGAAYAAPNNGKSILYKFISTFYCLNNCVAFGKLNCEVNTIKPVLSGHSKIDKTKTLMTKGSLMKVQSIAECSPWSILKYF